MNSLSDRVEETIRQEINPRDSWRASKAFLGLQIGGECKESTDKNNRTFRGNQHE